MIGDLGFGVVDKFANEFPDRFINAGISEQNMTSVATGLAMCGNKVYTYSIGNFPTLRCLEQVRNLAAYHNANVKIVSIGAGVAYGGAGITHHATEDLSILRAIPNITIFSPADKDEAIVAAQASFATNGVCYVRLGKGGEQTLHELCAEAETVTDIFKPRKIRSGKGKTVILATGTIATEALKAAEQLYAPLWTIPTVKPLPETFIEQLARDYDTIVTFEEHQIQGGFGGAVSEVVAGLNGNRASVKRIGFDNQFSAQIAPPPEILTYYGITAENLVRQLSEQET
jgi:transketolase